MSFLVLLLVAVIMGITPLRRGLPIDLPARWTQWVEVRTGGRSVWFALLLLLAPLLLIGLMAWLLAAKAYGVFDLIFQALVLLCCVGRTDPLGTFTRNFDLALERGDLEAASLTAERDYALVAEGPAELLVAIRSRMAWEACYGLFVPVFWFVLLGPVAALGYRLFWLARHRLNFAAAGVAGPVVHALEWLPARLMVLAFALVGHYERTLEYLRRVAAQWDVSSEAIMLGGVNAAAGTEHDVLESGVLAETRGLLQRTVLVWAVAIALLVMIG